MKSFSRSRSAQTYVSNVPWRSGSAFEEGLTSAEVIVRAGLDYTVEKRRLFVQDGPNDRDLDNYNVVDGHFATVRTDTNAVLGVVKSRYQIVQNRHAFEFFDSVIGKGKVRYESAGTLKGGALAWLMAKLPGHMRIGKDDLVDKMLLFHTGHDGSSSIVGRIMPKRNVCENTLTVSMREATMSIRHTANAEEQLYNARHIMNISSDVFDDLSIIFNQMYMKPFLSADLKKYVEELVPDNKQADSNFRTEHMRERIYELVETGKGSDSARGTIWGAYNGVTEYVDHIMGSGNAGKALASMWFGTGEALKNKAFQLAKELLN